MADKRCHTQHKHTSTQTCLVYRGILNIYLQIPHTFDFAQSPKPPSLPNMPNWWFFFFSFLFLLCFYCVCVCVCVPTSGARIAKFYAYNARAHTQSNILILCYSSFIILSNAYTCNTTHTRSTEHFYMNASNNNILSLFGHFSVIVCYYCSNNQNLKPFADTRICTMLHMQPNAEYCPAVTNARATSNHWFRYIFYIYRECSYNNNKYT